MSPASYQTAPPRDVCCTAPTWTAPGLRHSGPVTQSGKRDSNPRPQPWQGCALPTELFPRADEEFSDRAPAAQPSGGEGDRTPDLVNAIHALSQLSYAPGSAAPPVPATLPDASGARRLQIVEKSAMMRQHGKLAGLPPSRQAATYPAPTTRAVTLDS